MRAALIQMPVVHDKKANLQYACRAITQAAEHGIDLAVLPEMFCCPYAGKYFRAYGEPLGGMAQTTMADLAAKLGITLVAGSLPELEGDRVYNTSFVYGPDGAQLARHRKIHLFDIDVKGDQRFFESETLTAGDAITTFDAPFGRVGLCICFDFRFEELARLMALRGAQLLVVPAAFNMTTGPAHWELLFRQRAVDNQLFTLGVAPARDPQGEYVSYGNTIAVSPWGDVLARLGGQAGGLLVDLDLDTIPSIREQLPILSARRTDLYHISGGGQGPLEP